MVAHAFNPSTQEAEAEASLVYRVAQDSQGYTASIPTNKVDI